MRRRAVVEAGEAGATEVGETVVVAAAVAADLDVAVDCVAPAPLGMVAAASGMRSATAGQRCSSPNVPPPPSRPRSTTDAPMNPLHGRTEGPQCRHVLAEGHLAVWVSAVVVPADARARIVLVGARVLLRRLLGPELTLHPALGRGNLAPVVCSVLPLKALVVVVEAVATVPAARLHVARCVAL